MNNEHESTYTLLFARKRRGGTCWKLRFPWCASWARSSGSRNL